LLLLLAVSAAALLVGQGDLHDARLRDTLLELRAYRLAAAFLTGSALAVGGVVVQGLFRNPLADPSLLGATAGASLGGQATMMLYQLALAGRLAGRLPAQVFLPIGCLLGALVALLVLLGIARRHGDLVLLLLTGFILSALFLALGNFIMSLAQEKWELGRAMVAFALGGLSGTSGVQVVMAAPLALAGVAAAWFWGRPLDLLLSGEDESASLGVDVPAVRRWSVVWSAALTGAAVSLGGNIGFVGLIVPHALRALIGVEHRRLVPAATLGGGAFVIACDVLARAIPARTELPLGVVTGLLGAPFFLWLLLRTWRGGEHG
jgi:iron complex transport system permease protein